MKNIRFNMLLGICFFLLFALLGACGGGDSPITDEIDDGKQDGQKQYLRLPILWRRKRRERMNCK
jgi:hypothetical protein